LLLPPGFQTSVTVLATLLAHSVKNGVSTKKGKSYESQGTEGEKKALGLKKLAVTFCLKTDRST